MSKRIVCFLLVLSSALMPLGFSSAQDDATYEGVWINLEFGIVVEVEGNAAKVYEAGCILAFEATREGDNIIKVDEAGNEELFPVTFQEDTIVLLDHGVPLVFERAESLESACAALLVPVDSTEELMAWAERDIPAEFPFIERRPAPADFGRGAMETIPTYDPTSGDPFQVDLRGFDLSALDLRDSAENLSYASFDDATVWPSDDQLPPDFDWQYIMELGKDPGLGVRDLHAQGIAGQGIGIAIIDAPLLVDHQEYADRLRWYEETKDVASLGQGASMHGLATASIAVGQTVGVAPEADLYFIATSYGGSTEPDFTYLAAGIRRILNINQQLPEDRKIRVISMSIGWLPTRKGYDEVTAAAAEAKAAGILVICSSTEEVHGFKFGGLGRSPLNDPALAASYEPGLFWRETFAVAHENEMFSNALLVPMDSRTTASPTGNEDYVFYREGGWSWAIPYIAGMYALAAQVDPAITPDQFWSLALQTGQTIDWEYNGETIPLGLILDPVALIEELQNQ